MKYKKEGGFIYGKNELNPEWVVLGSANDVWWCDKCKKIVQDDHVTYEETHDPKRGGCGSNLS